MDNNGREYRYQADWSLGSQMYHVRADDWTEFQDAVKNIRDTYLTEEIPVKQVAPPFSANPYPTPEGESACKTCGAATLPEKKIVGKDGRSWWVRDCSSGDRTHKGPIRPAS
jgi:hypothetical protein